ncbi:hypothetical protein FB451DRAFT_1206462, partial [Mycena latifolia]
MLFQVLHCSIGLAGYFLLQLLEVGSILSFHSIPSTPLHPFSRSDRVSTELTIGFSSPTGATNHLLTNRLKASRIKTNASRTRQHLRLSRRTCFRPLVCIAVQLRYLADQFSGNALESSETWVP